MNTRTRKFAASHEPLWRIEGELDTSLRMPALLELVRYSGPRNNDRLACRLTPVALTEAFGPQWQKKHRELEFEYLSGQQRIAGALFNNLSCFCHLIGDEDNCADPKLLSQEGDYYLWGATVCSESICEDCLNNEGGVCKECDGDGLITDETDILFVSTFEFNVPNTNPPCYVSRAMFFDEKDNIAWFTSQVERLTRENTPNEKRLEK